MGKPDPPPPPDYTPLIQGQTAVAASDVEAAKIQAALGEKQLEQQGIYAQKASDLGDKYAQMATDAAAFGKQQYEDIKPYLASYMNEQMGFQTAATVNEQAQAAAALESNRQAKDTYDRYTSTFAPKEDQFAKEAYEFGSPARQDQDAAAAKGDVATTFQANKDAAGRQLASYGIDPTQGRYTGQRQALDIAGAASEAAAGTMARKQTEAQGKQYELAATEIGQKLPAQAIGQAGLALNQTGSGLAGAGVGGAGIAAGSNLLQTGTTAMGSPTSYAALNPYTQLTNTYGTVGGGLYGNSNTALGNASNAYTGAGNTMNNMFSNQITEYKAQAAASPWNAIGNIAGNAIGFAATKMISDRRLKRDIARVGTLDNGLPVYAFRYIGEYAMQIGLMADEVEMVHPEAVIAVGPHAMQMVNYALAVLPVVENRDG